MKGSVRVGTTGENRFVVGPRHVIDFTDGGMPGELGVPSVNARCDMGGS